MRNLGLSVIAGLTLLSAAAADGLVYRLPEDGAFVRFDMEATKGAPGKVDKVQGALVLSSVGRKDVAGKPCRWLEFKTIGQAKDDTSIIKVLIPEDKLRAGQNPAAHIVSAWYKRRDQPVVEINDAARRLGPFLHPPAKEVKKLVDEVVDSKLGKLACAGRAGTVVFKDKETVHLDYQCRLHDQAPFGVVSLVLNFTGFRDGKEQGRGSIRLRLVDMGKGARSELPDQK